MVHTEIVGTNIIEKNIDMEMRDKFLYLLEIVKKAEGKRVLVFVSTKKDAENVERKLGKSGYFAASIHGDKSQKFREQSLKDFKSGKTNILVATDVAARGLQIDNVEFVVNYDNARDKDTHKHRIGRTGRMGATGYAINFITPDDAYKNARRDGKRAVRSNHSIDNKGTNVWDLVNKSRHFDGNRDHRFGNRNRDRTNARSGRREFRENFNVELNDSPKEPKAENVLLHLENSEHKETRSENKHEQNEIERPKRSFDDRDRKPFRDKRSRDSPRRDFGDKPRFGRDKPSFGKRHSIDGPDNSESKFGDRKRSFGDKPRFSKDGPRRSFGDRDRKSFGDNPSFGKDRPRKSFGRDRESKFDPSDKSKGFESRTYQDRKEGFVPKSFRRDKEYMNSRPEYRNKDKEDTKDKHKDKKQNLKKGRNLKFQGRFPRKSF
jgi:superfamily II DNA/RNA helicase